MAQFKPEKRKLSAPSMGGSKANPLEALMLAQSKMMMNQQAQQQEAQNRQSNIGSNITDVTNQLKGTYGGSIPVGTDINVGGQNTTASVPLNRELTGDERSDLEHAEVIDQYASTIENYLNEDPDSFGKSFGKAASPGGSIFSLGDQKALEMNKLLADWRDRILRTRSKSQTTEKEFGRIRGFATPGLKDLSIQHDENDPNITYPSVRSHIMRVRDSAKRVKDMILSGANSMEYMNNPASPIPGTPNYQAAGNTQQDPVEAIKARFKQRNP